MAGTAGGVASLVPAPPRGRLFAATRDDLRGALERSEIGASSGLRLFVTRAGEATKKEDELLEAEAEAAAAGTDLDALREDASPGPAVPSLDDDTCPICLEVPGAGGDGELYRYDLRTNPFANEERLKNVVAAKCCGAPFCRSCLAEYLPKFPKGTGCPFCRDVDLFEATVPGLCQWRGAKHRESGAPWREISLDFETLPWLFRPPGTRRAEAADETPETPETLPRDFLRVRGRARARGGGDPEAGLDDGFARASPRGVFARRAGPARATPMADGKPVFGRAGLERGVLRTDAHGADPPPEHISADFLRGMAPTDLVVSAAVGGPSPTGHVANAGEAGGEKTRSDDAFVPTTRASFVGFARHAGGEDETLIRSDGSPPVHEWTKPRACSRCSPSAASRF